MAYLELALAKRVNTRLPDAVPSEIRREQAAGGEGGRRRLIIDLEWRLQDVERHAASEDTAKCAGLVFEYRGVAAVAVQAQHVEQAAAGARSHGHADGTFDDGAEAAAAMRLAREHGKCIHSK